MATLDHPVPARAGAIRLDHDAEAPRKSGFEILIPVAALYVILLVIGPFIAMAFRHATT